MPAPPRYCLLDLPLDSLSVVASFLCDADVVALSSSCTQLRAPAMWAEKLRSFGIRGVSALTARDAGRLHRRCARALNGVGAGAAARSGTFAISWLDSPQYWQRDVPEGSSPFGAMHVLQHVCWLDVQGTLEVVGGGSFLVALRVRKQSPRADGIRLACSLAVTGQEAAVAGTELPGASTHVLTPTVDLCTLPSTTWVWLFLGTVDVAPRAGAITRVHVHAQDHSGSWKTGIAVDRLVAVPASDVDRVSGTTGFAQNPVAFVPCSQGEAPRWCPDGA